MHVICKHLYNTQKWRFLFDTVTASQSVAMFCIYAHIMNIRYLCFLSVFHHVRALTMFPFCHSFSKKAIIEGVTCHADVRLRLLTEQRHACNGSGTNRGSRCIDKSPEKSAGKQTFRTIDVSYHLWIFRTTDFSCHSRTFRTVVGILRRQTKTASKII